MASRRRCPSGASLPPRRVLAGGHVGVTGSCRPSPSRGGQRPARHRRPAPRWSARSRGSCAVLARDLPELRVRRAALSRSQLGAPSANACAMPARPLGVLPASSPIALLGFSMGGGIAIGVAGDPRVRGVIGLAPWVPDPDLAVGSACAGSSWRSSTARATATCRCCPACRPSTPRRVHGARRGRGRAHESHPHRRSRSTPSRCARPLGLLPPAPRPRLERGRRRAPPGARARRARARCRAG